MSSLRFVFLLLLIQLVLIDQLFALSPTPTPQAISLNKYNPAELDKKLKQALENQKFDVNIHRLRKVNAGSKSSSISISGKSMGSYSHEKYKGLPKDLYLADTYRGECDEVTVKCGSEQETNESCGGGAGICMSCENCDLYMLDSVCDAIGITDGEKVPPNLDPTDLDPGDTNGALAQCGFKHELTHGSQDCNNMSSCMMEEGAYEDQIDCLLAQIEEEGVDPVEIGLTICKLEGRLAQAACQAKRPDCSCTEGEDCNGECEDEIKNCIRRLFPEMPNLENFSDAFADVVCEGDLACHYCPEDSKPSYCETPTPTPSITLTPTNTVSPSPTAATPTATPDDCDPSIQDCDPSVN